MQYSEPQRKRNNRIVYAVVLLKLALDSLLVLVLHHSLAVWKLGLFGKLTDDYGKVRDVIARLLGVEIGYPTYLIGGMVLSAILYALTIQVIQIQNRLRYAVFAILYVADSLFLLYPCRELLTVMLCILLLLSLRRKDIFRYILAGLVVILAAILVSPYLIVMAALYIGVRAWERDSRWGIGAFLLMLIAFTVLYESGALLFLQELRGESTEGARYFAKVFPPENYAGHVSYYLLDYLSVLARLMFPYEAFLQRNPLVYVFFFTQVGLLLWFVGSMFLESEAVHRNRRHSDRMRTDVTVAAVGVLLALGFFVQDYVEAFRFVISFYPLYLYLFFGTVWQPLALEKEAAPVDGSLVFLHRGGERYVYDALRQACDVVSEEKVILLGDAENRGFCTNWCDLGELRSDETSDEAMVLSEKLPFSEAVTKKLSEYALVYAFLCKHSLHRVILCESDLLLFENLCERELSDEEWLLLAPADRKGAPALVSFTDVQLKSFLMYVNRYDTKMAETPLDEISMTTLLDEWYEETAKSGAIRRVNPGDEETVYLTELTKKQEGLSFDSGLGMVKLRFRDGVPYASMEERLVRVGAFRVLRHREDIPVLLDGSNVRIRYVLNRMMNQ